VFTPDRRHLIYSRDLLRNIWNETLAETISQKSAGDLVEAQIS
jgi:hypothetical protein